LRPIAGVVFVATAALAGGCGNVMNNGPPECAITSPADAGSTVYVDEAVAFSVEASDGGTTPSLLGFAWTSDLGDTLPEGNLNDDGEHAFATDDLSPGAHTITATVTDPDGESCVDTVPVTVLAGDPPTIEIDTPRSDGFYYVDRPLTLRSTVADTEDDPTDLRVFWAVEDGEGLAEGLEPDVEGVTTIEREFEVGTHVLEARVVDTHGNSGAAGVVVTVGGPNQPPECGILAPLDFEVLAHGPDLELRGDATDPNVPSTALGVSFTSDVDGPLGDTTPNDSGDVSLIVPTLSVGEHELTMLVVDDLGVECDDSVTVVVDEPPVAEITAPTAATPASDNLVLLLQGLAIDREDANETLLVEWFSDVDGLIADKEPQPDGTLDDEAPPETLTPGAHTITLEVTDSLGSTATDSVSIVVNGAPGRPTAQITPGGPTTVDSLIASVATPPTDPENDPLTYVYGWLIDNVAAPAYDGLTTIPDTATSKNENWQVEIRAFDGQTYGLPGVADVTVANTPPVGGAATVTPTLGTTATSFSLVTTGWQDVDGDAEGYLYQWVVNNVAVAGATGATFVPGAAANPGDPLHCELTPWDGEDAAPMFVSGPAFINVPAVPTTVTISPTPAYETTTLVSTWTGGVDPEGATTTPVYQWYENCYAAVPTPIAGATSSTLTGADFDHFDEVCLGLSLDDGTEIGPVTFSNIVDIQNTPPSTTTPSISPTLLYTNTQAICVPGPLTDPDPDTVTAQYAWMVGPNLVAGQTTSVLDGSVHFDKGQTVRCIVTPHDGYVAGAPQESIQHLVQNSAPTAPGVDVTPDTPGDDNPLSCVDSTPSFDADNDAVSYSRSWTVNGNATVYTAQNLLASTTNVGETWECTMTPWDGSVTGPAGSDSVLVQGSVILGPGPAGSTYSQQGQTRGMWFEATTNMTITGLWIPAETNAADVQNVQVVLLPPSWGTGSSTSTATTLFYANQMPAGDFMVTNIPVLAGDKIGLLGARGTSTMHSMYSPGNAPVVVPYGSASLSLHRLEYDDNLWNVSAGLIHDATGPIGRVEIEYIP